MARIVVADTSPLIALGLLDLLPVLLKLFDEVLIPETVAQEALADLSLPGAKAIAAAIELEHISCHPVEFQQARDQELVTLLDKGEAEAIILAQSLNAVLIIDEKKGRKVALEHQLKIIGTGAILVAAKREGFIPSVRPALSCLNEHGYRLSKALIEEIIKLAKE